MYQWVKLLHIATAAGFLAVHGASIVLLYAIRKERDRARIGAMLDLSARTASAMYVSLAAVVGTGLWLGFQRSGFFRQGWYWWSLALLVVTGLIMWFVAKPYTKKVRTASEIRPSGVPRVSDEELAQILRSPTTHLITTIGVVALGAILYLMVFQPELATAAGPDSNGGALLERGKEIYDATAGGRGCAQCHGFDGQGTAEGPDITGASKAAIAEALDVGPGMRDVTLNADELEAVYQYLQTLP